MEDRSKELLTKAANLRRQEKESLAEIRLISDRAERLRAIPKVQTIRHSRIITLSIVQQHLDHVNLKKQLCKELDELTVKFLAAGYSLSTNLVDL